MKKLPVKLLTELLTSDEMIAAYAAGLADLSDGSRDHLN